MNIRVFPYGSLSPGYIPHSTLLTGERRTGKTTLLLKRYGICDLPEKCIIVPYNSLYAMAIGMCTDLGIKIKKDNIITPTNIKEKMDKLPPINWMFYRLHRYDG